MEIWEHGVVRERRRRRLEGEGLPFEELPRESFVGAQSLSEAIRTDRQRAASREKGPCHAGPASFSVD
jgi:hypothetical protein